MIVAFEVTAVGPGAWIGAYIYRARCAFGSGHMDHDHVLALDLVHIRHTVGQDIAADFLAVVDHVPEILYCLVGVRQAFHHEASMSFFVDSEHDYSAIGVGERGIRLPQRTWHAAAAGLDFQSAVFLICRQSFKTKGFRRLHILL